MTGTVVPAAGSGPRALASPGRLELAILVALLALAALTRLPGLAERGRWDADQGTDMRVLRGLVVDGTVPLLGPRTSIGTFHHGAVYYYLLAPSAYASAADPVTVTAEIALFGIAAVAGAWWLGRLAGGPLAAAGAGLLAALSPAGIDESTFIWNPNLIPVAAALAFAATIRARRSGQARWWLLAGLGAMVTLQCHVLGVVIVLPLAWAWAADAVGRRRRGATLDGVVRGGAGAVLVIAAGFLPLLVYELGHDFAETRGILEYVAGGGREAAAGVIDRVLMVGVRSITWPVSGLITDRVPVSLVAALLVVVLGSLAVLGRRRAAGPASVDPAVTAAGPASVDPADAADPAVTRWLVASIGLSVVLLAVFAPSLAVVVPDLPNDHYHAFLDPVVLAVTGAGLARLATRLPGRTVGRAFAGAATVLLVAMAITSWPPAVAPDGGWPLADAAAGRVQAQAGDEPVVLDGLPPFKNDNAFRFPLERRGVAVLPARTDPATVPGIMVVLVCDPLFDAVTGTPCGSAAEDDWLAASGREDLRLLDRFAAGSRRLISVYAAAAP